MPNLVSVSLSVCSAGGERETASCLKTPGKMDPDAAEHKERANGPERHLRSVRLTSRAAAGSRCAKQ